MDVYTHITDWKNISGESEAADLVYCLLKIKGLHGADGRDMVFATLSAVRRYIIEETLDDTEGQKELKIALDFLAKGQ